MYNKGQKLIITGQIKKRVGEVVTYSRPSVFNKCWVIDKNNKELVMPLGALAPIIEHNDFCDINPNDLTMTKNIKAGDSYRICISCFLKIKETNEHKSI